MIVLMLFLLMALMVQYFEKQFAAENMVNVPLANTSLFNTVKWFLIFSLTGYEVGVFPQSTGGQLIAALSPLLGLSAIALTILAELIISHNRKRRKSGMQDINFEQHIVISGCNDRLPELLIKAIGSLKSSFIKSHYTKYLILDHRFKQILDSHKELENMHRKKEFEFINGDPKNDYYLEKANIDKADTVILLADDKSREADERTLLRALSISRFCRKKVGQEALDAIYIIAEVNHTDLRDSFYQADVNEIICSGEVSENVIIQSSFNHGMSEILDELISYNEFNEFYLMDGHEYPMIVGKTFDELLPELRKKAILLIGIKVIFYENSHEIIDKDEISHRLMEFKLKRQIITNPINLAENQYKLRKDDQIFVLAEDEQSIKKHMQSN